MNNSKNENKNFGTILTNDDEKMKDKGGNTFGQKYNESDKGSDKFVDDNKNNHNYNDKEESSKIIGTGYDNDFMNDFVGDAHHNIKHGISNVDGIFDDGKFFKDDYNNHFENNKEKGQENHFDKEDSWGKDKEDKWGKDKEESTHHENNNGSSKGKYDNKHYDWTCEDVLCETEFNCECEPINEALADIVESIAHQENGLAKILDSESKKICKAICIAACVDDLVKVNKSVQNTIKQINNVQIVLISKLQEVSDICDGCHDDCDNN